MGNIVKSIEEKHCKPAYNGGDIKLKRTLDGYGKKNGDKRGDKR